MSGWAPVEHPDAGGPEDDAPPPWPGLDGLTDRHLALYRALWRSTRPGTATATVKQAKLAEAIGLKGEPRPGEEAQGSRQVRRLMRDLIRRGWVVEIPRMVPGPNGGQRQGASGYTLKVPLLDLPSPPSPQVAPLGHGIGPGRTARTWPEGPSAQVAPLGHASSCPSKNVLRTVKRLEVGESVAHW